MSKYRAIKTTLDGIKFDSQKEAGRYLQLKALEKLGEIRELELQPAFKIEIKGKKICTYKADFRYKTKGGEEVIEDVKGFQTPVFRLKKKLVEAMYGIKLLIT